MKNGIIAVFEKWMHASALMKYLRSEGIDGCRMITKHAVRADPDQEQRVREALQYYDANTGKRFSQ